MRRLVPAVRFAMAAVLLGFLAGGTARADVLRVGGAGAGTATVAAMSDAVAAMDGIVVQTQPSLGSAGAMRALAAGRIDLAILGRGMTAEEAKSGALVAGAIRTPFVFVTSRTAPAAMSLAEIVRAYGDPRAQWGDGSPVILVLRLPTEGDAIVHERMSVAMAAAVAVARKRPEVLVSGSDDDNMTVAGETKGSLTTMSFSHLMIQGRKLSAISIDGVAPSLAAMMDGSYPFRRSFVLVLPSTPSAAAVRFVALLRGERGGDALRGVHSVFEGLR